MPTGDHPLGWVYQFNWVVACAGTAGIVAGAARGAQGADGAHGVDRPVVSD
jgi:hypothetical protein